MTINEKNFRCRICGASFTKRTRYAYYCDTCKKKHNSERVMASRARDNPNVKVGVGSGGNQWGERNHMFKTGRANYKDVFDRENPQQVFCEVCYGTRYLVVHHIDGNRKNNESENLIKICRSCHAKVHHLEKNFR